MRWLLYPLITVFMMTGCSGSKDSKEVELDEELVIDVRVKSNEYHWHLSSQPVHGDGLDFQIRLANADGLEIRVQDGEFILTVEDQVFDLAHHRDPQLFGQTLTYSVYIPVNTQSARQANIELTLNGETRTIDFVVPELLDVTLDGHIIEAYNPAVDTLNIAWSSGLPLTAIEVIQPGFVTETDEVCQEFYYVFSPDQQASAHTITPGALEYSCDPEDRSELILRQDEVPLTHVSYGFSHTSLTFFQHYRHNIITAM
ncbi:hypothetical protein ACFSJ3_11965 [Corallincola platygyrae]|uniref:Uncharacterized protein n=1 Tax=Corallincola platygyrae TaxID=1193278 RepID=A0ABW4XR09_9GAMM